jgi:hypothetical protein
MGAERIYYIDEGKHLRAIHAVRGPDGKYRPTGVEERVSFPIVQAAISKQLGRPDLHPTELGFDELGAGKVRKAIKKAAKKVAKSKVMKKIVKVAKVVAPIAAMAVPGGQALAAAQLAIKVGKGVKKGKAAAKAAKKVAAPAAAVAKASARLRATVKPTSEAAETPEAALLREQRLDEASKALATVPPDEQPEAIAKIESRLDSFKVVTPNGNTVWVDRATIEAGA